MRGSIHRRNPYTNDLKNIKNVGNTTKHELDSNVNFLFSYQFMLKCAEQSAYLNDS